MIGKITTNILIPAGVLTKIYSTRYSPSSTMVGIAPAQGTLRGLMSWLPFLCSDDSKTYYKHFEYPGQYRTHSGDFEGSDLMPTFYVLR